MRLEVSAMRPCFVLAAVLLCMPSLTWAQPGAPAAATGPVANDFAFFYRHDIRTGCTDFRCRITPLVDIGQLFTEDDLSGVDTGTQLETSGASSSGGRVGFSGSGTSFLPAISVYSFSQATTRVQNTFAGVQRYTLGAGVTSLTLNGALSFTSAGVPSFFSPATGPGPDPMIPQGVVFGGIFVWQAAALDFGNCDAYNLGIEAGAICFISDDIVGATPLLWPSVTRLASSTFDNSSIMSTLTLGGLTAGQEIFVGGWVTTVSGFGGFVDARNTVRLSFNDPVAVTPAVQTETFAPAELPPSVPEPATWTLLGLGLAGMTVRRCGRR